MTVGDETPMDIKYYPVILERGESDSGDVGFGAFFPDLPGCVSGGDSQEETLLSAEKALEMHVTAMRKDGESIPEPSPLGTMEHDPDVKEVLRTLVRVKIPASPVFTPIHPFPSRINQHNFF